MCPERGSGLTQSRHKAAPGTEDAESVPDRGPGPPPTASGKGRGNTAVTSDTQDEQRHASIHGFLRTRGFLRSHGKSGTLQPRGSEQRGCGGIRAEFSCGLTCGQGQGSEIGSLPFGAFLSYYFISALGLCLEGIAEPIGPKRHLVLGLSCSLCCPQGSLQPGPALGLQAGAPGLPSPLNDCPHFKGPSTPSTTLLPPVPPSSAQTHIEYLLQF